MQLVNALLSEVSPQPLMCHVWPLSGGCLGECIWESAAVSGGWFAQTANFEHPGALRPWSGSGDEWHFAWCHCHNERVQHLLLQGQVSLTSCSFGPLLTDDFLTAAGAWTGHLHRAEHLIWGWENACDQWTGSVRWPQWHCQHHAELSDRIGMNSSVVIIKFIPFLSTQCILSSLDYCLCQSQQLREINNTVSEADAQFTQLSDRITTLNLFLNTLTAEISAVEDQINTTTVSWSFSYFLFPYKSLHSWILLDLCAA